MCDHETLRLVYQVKANHIESLKTALWRNAYYTILAQSGIIGVSKLFRSDNLPIPPCVLPFTSVIICLFSLYFALHSAWCLRAERRDQRRILGTLSPSIQGQFAKGQKGIIYGRIWYEVPFAIMYIVPVVAAEVFVLWYFVKVAPWRLLGAFLSILFASIAIFVICSIVRWWARDC